jgi:NTE family protein
MTASVRRRSSGTVPVADQIRIGVALGGGAVRGAAHIGVLAALQAAGLRPDIVTGTSVGAIVGALFAGGLEPAEISTLARTLRWSRLVRPGLGQPGLLDSSRLGRLLDDRLGHGEFVDLELPLAVVACDLTTGDPVVLEKGRVATAVMASAAIPGVFAPVERDGLLLVDGGLVDLVPARLARRLGADVVIAVDVSGAAPHRRPTSLVEVIVAATHLPAGAAQCLAHESDLLLVPHVDEYAIWDLGRIAEFETAGRRAAERAVPLVRALVDVARARRHLSLDSLQFAPS